MKTFVFILVLLGIGAGGTWYMAGRSAGPQIEIAEPSRVIGQNGQIVVLVTAPDAKLNALDVTLEQGELQIPVFKLNADPKAAPAVDKDGRTIDFLLTPTRDRDAAEAFLRKAIHTQGLPEKITIDKSGSNTAAIQHYNKTHKTAIIMRQSKYLNNLVEQDHRAVKRVVRPMLGFKSFWAARCTIAGIEVMHAIRKGQLPIPEHAPQTPAEQFYALAA